MSVTLQDAHNDLKKIQCDLEKVDNQLDLLRSKKSKLQNAQQRIMSQLNIQHFEFNPSKYKQTRQSDKVDPTNQSKTGRKLYSDAYKNYIVKLCDVFNLKSIEQQTGVLYTNIVRWRLEINRGEVKRDDSYIPTSIDLKLEENMLKHKPGENVDEECSNYLKNKKIEQDTDYVDDNRQTSSTNSDDYQDRNQQQFSQNNRKNFNSVKEYRQDHSIDSPRRYNRDDEMVDEDKDNYMEKMLEINPNFKTDWYNNFEQQLVDEINGSQQPVSMKNLLSLAKNIRNMNQIAESDLKFTKKWYEDFIIRRDINLSA